MITFSKLTTIYFCLIILLGNFFVMNIMLAVIKSKFTQVHESYLILENNEKTTGKSKKDSAKNAKHPL